MGDFVVGLVLGVIVGVLIVGLIVGNTWSRDTGALGQSICDQEFGMDYGGYNDVEGLTCIPKLGVNQEQYDGVIVNLPEDSRDVQVVVRGERDGD